MNENEKQRYPAQSEQAPPSLMPALLARLGLDGSEQAHPTSLAELRIALAHHMWTVRAAAVQDIERLNDADSWQLLLTVLEDEDPSVRASAVRVLGMRGDPADQSVYARLLAALRDPEWHVRETAVYALGALGGSTALLTVCDSLYDNDDTVRRAALLVIQRLPREARDAEQDLNHLAPEKVTRVGEASIETRAKRMRRSALRLLPRSYPYTEKELDMSEEIQDVIVENSPIIAENVEEETQFALLPTARPRRRLVRLLEQGLAAVLVLALVVGWFTLSHLPRTTSTAASLSFSDAKALPLGAPIYTTQGSLSYAENWSADGHTFFYLQTNTQKNELEVQAVDAASNHSITYPVLDSSWVASLKQYNIFQIGHYLVALRPQGKSTAMMEIWDITGRRATITRTVPALIEGNGEILTTSIASQNGQKFALYMPDGTLEIWDAASGQKLATCKVKIPSNLANSANFFPLMQWFQWYDHDQYLLFYDRGSHYQAWNTTTGGSVFSQNDPTRTYVPVLSGFSPDGKYLSMLAGPQPKANRSFHADTLEILDAHSGRVLHTYPQNMPSNTDALYTWLPDSQRLMTIEMRLNTQTIPSDFRTQIHIWNVFTGQVTFDLSVPHAGYPQLTPDHRYLLLNSLDGRSITIWQTENGRRVATVATPGMQVDQYAIFTVSNKYMVIGEKGDFYTWDIASGKLLYKYHGVTPFSVAGNGGGNTYWSPDGRYLAMIAFKISSVGEGVLAIWRML